MKKKNSTFIVAMIPAGIALNVVANSIIELLKLPLFLNNIGNVLNAIVLGPWWGVATAFMTDIILGLTVRWTYVPFGIVGAIVALLAYWFFQRGWFKKFWKVIVSGVVIGILGSIVATIIAVFVFGGFSGHTVDVITAGLVAAGEQIFAAAFIANLPVQTLDKILTVWIVWMILRIFPARYLPNAKDIQAKLGMNNKKKKVEDDLTA